MMKELLQETLGKGKDYTAEATYYCDENEYQYQKARQAFLEDRKFEREMRGQRKSRKSYVGRGDAEER